jgi:hypothetical protein
MRTLEACREELASTLEDWLLFGISRHLETPTLNGMDLAVKEVGESACCRALARSSGGSYRLPSPVRLRRPIRGRET